MTDNKNIFTNNKKSDNQNVKDNLLIDELDTYSDYVHEFSDSYKNRKEEFLRSLESVNEHKATGKENTVIKNLNNTIICFSVCRSLNSRQQLPAGFFNT